jgi:hypothetical protein
MNISANVESTQSVWQGWSSMVLACIYPTKFILKLLGHKICQNREQNGKGEWRPKSKIKVSTCATKFRGKVDLIHSYRGQALFWSYTSDRITLDQDFIYASHSIEESLVERKSKLKEGKKMKWWRDRTGLIRLTLFIGLLHIFNLPLDN